jgi:propanol-preferring alcohol dehydrogenase
MFLDAPRTPLVRRDLDVREPGVDEVRLRVLACGVCRTDLHVVDGELTKPKLPIVPGHEIVGVIEAIGARVSALHLGDRVGVPWLGSTCGHCRYCARHDENLCDNAIFTGYTRDGGFATHVVADARYCFRIPSSLGDVEAAPLLCAGLIGYRSYRMLPQARDASRAPNLGLYGFGAAAHILAQVALHDHRRVYAFTRDGDVEGQRFARSLGCTWAGGSSDAPPETLDAAIVLAPVGALVPRALAHVDKGGVVVCGGIHMSDIPSFPYELLWGERVLRSVANLTRDDGALLDLAARIPVHTTTHTYALVDANRALDDLRHGRFEGAAVLVP